MSAGVPDRARWRGVLLAVGGLVLGGLCLALVLVTPGAVDTDAAAAWLRACLLVSLAGALALTAANVVWARAGRAPRLPLTLALTAGGAAVLVAVLGALFFLVDNGPDATDAAPLGAMAAVPALGVIALSRVTRREGA